MRCWYLLLLLTKCRHLQAERQDLELDHLGEDGPTAMQHHPDSSAFADLASEDAGLSRLATLEVSGDEDDEARRLLAASYISQAPQHTGQKVSGRHASAEGQTQETFSNLQQENQELRRELEAASGGNQVSIREAGSGHIIWKSLGDRNIKPASLAQLVEVPPGSPSEEEDQKADALSRLPKVHYNKLHSLLAEGGAIEKSLEATRTEAEQVTAKAEEWRLQESNMIAAAEKMSKESEKAERHLAAGVKSLQDDRVKIASEIAKEQAEEESGQTKSQDSSEPTKDETAEKNQTDTT